MTTLIDPRDIAEIRTFSRNFLGWSPKVESPLRAVTCRCCGEKISAGTEAIKAGVCFSDTASSWASTWAYIHQSCEPKVGAVTKRIVGPTGFLPK